MPSTPRTTIVLGLFLAGLIGCGSTGDGPYTTTPPPPPPSGSSLSIAGQSGDGQEAGPGVVLAPFRVLVRLGGTPAAGRTVMWAVLTGSGTLSSTSATTGADGVAETTLTLGEGGGVQVNATLQGASGSPVTFFGFALVAGQIARVAVTNDVFMPQNTTISEGGKVLFHYPVGSSQHNVLPVGANPLALPYQPDLRNGPLLYEATFPAGGTYDFYCSNHGAPDSGMRGRVTVQ